MTIGGFTIAPLKNSDIPGPVTRLRFLFYFCPLQMLTSLMDKYFTTQIFQRKLLQKPKIHIKLFARQAQSWQCLKQFYSAVQNTRVQVMLIVRGSILAKAKYFVCLLLINTRSLYRYFHLGKPFLNCTYLHHCTFA